MPPSEAGPLWNLGKNSGLDKSIIDQTQKVTVEGVASEPVPVKSGVPQGSVLKAGSRLPCVRGNQARGQRGRLGPLWVGGSGGKAPNGK